MRKFDVIILALVISMGVWSYILHGKPGVPVCGETGAPVGAGRDEDSGKLQQRLDRLEDELRQSCDQQRAAGEALERAREEIRSLRGKEKESAGAKESARDSVMLSKSELDELIKGRIQEYLDGRRKEAEQKGEELLEKRKNELLDQWAEGAVKALNLIPEDKNTLKEMLQERNGVLAGELVNEEGRFDETKLLALVKGEKLKNANEEMCLKALRSFGPAASEDFKKYCRKEPPPIVITTPDGLLGVVRASEDGLLDVRAIRAGGPARQGGETPDEAGK